MKQIPIFRVTGTFLVLVFLCSVLFGCGGTGSAADDAYLTQVTASVTEAQSLIDEMISFSNEMTEATGTFSENKDSDAYVEQCRTKLTLLEEKVAAVQELQQQIEKSGAPSSDFGKAIEQEQKEYFEDMLLYLNAMQETLTFYTAQYDASLELLEAANPAQSSFQQYLGDLYSTTVRVKENLLALPTPSYLSTLWTHYVGAFDMLTSYLQSVSSAAAGDVLLSYSADQIISRVTIEGNAYEKQIADLMVREYVHSADVLENNLKVLGSEILSSCEKKKVPENSYVSQDSIVFIYHSLVDEIYPNLYPAADSAVNLLMYTDKSYCDVLVTAEIPGFTQVYEQKVTLSPEMTYLMIKPPILSELPNLSSTKETQLILKVTDCATGDVLAQESKAIKLYSIYDYKTYSDEFGVVQNDNLLAWMTPDSDGVLAVRRNAISWLENNFGRDYGKLPGYQYSYGFGQGQEAYVTFYQVAAIQSAISAMGVRYNMGPYSFDATQRVLMPDAVLNSKSGICIETAVLMASVLQSANMHPFLILTPGHAQVAVETWENSGQYFLIETTTLPFDATTDDNSGVIIQLDSQGWDEYLSQKKQQSQQSGGLFYLVDCSLAKVLNIRGLAADSYTADVMLPSSPSSSSDSGSQPSSGDASSVAPAPSSSSSSGTYTLESYDGGNFTMQLPKGWTIETGGAYAGFCFRAYDPQNPDAQIFFYGELGPYFKSQEGKDGYLAMSGGNDYLSDLPVLELGTLTACLDGLDEYEAAYYTIMGSSYNFADVHNLSNIVEQPVTTFLSPYAVSESMLKADLTSVTGVPCKGIFQGSIVDAGSYEIGGVDIAPSRGAMDLFGVIAPSDQFDNVADTLIASLGSFRFTEEYIQAGIDQTNQIGQSALEYSRQNMELMDRVMQDFSEYIRQ